MANNTTVNVQTTSTLVLAANASRNKATLTNLGSYVVYGTINAAALTGQGFRLHANGGKELIISTASVNAIALGGSASVAVLEL